MFEGSPKLWACEFTGIENKTSSEVS